MLYPWYGVVVCIDSKSPWQGTVFEDHSAAFEHGQCLLREAGGANFKYCEEALEKKKIPRASSFWLLSR